MPGYKQTEVGIIPTDWDAFTLSQVCRSISDGTHFTPQYVSTGVPFYSVENVTRNDFADTKFISEEEHERLIKRCKPERGDILMTRITAGKIGDTRIIDWDVDASIYVSLALLKPGEKTTPAFLYSYTKSLAFVREIEKRALLNATPKKINMGEIGRVLLPVPQSIEEQRRIAAALSDADALIAALEGMIAKKRDLKQAAMQHLLTGKTRLPGFSGEWEVKRLGETAQLHKGQVIPGSQPDTLFCHYSLPAFDNGRRPVLETGSEIGSNKFTVPSNSVLVSKLNPRIPRVWSLCSVPQNSVASTEFLVLLPKENLSLGFLSVLCGSTVFCEKMENAVTGTTGSHQRVAPKDAMRLEVDFPTDLNEQTAIAEVLSDMDADLAALEAQAAKARAVKQGMMQELLTGKVRLV